MAANSANYPSVSEIMSVYMVWWYDTKQLCTKRVLYVVCKTHFLFDQNHIQVVAHSRNIDFYMYLKILLLEISCLALDTKASALESFAYV